MKARLEKIAEQAVQIADLREGSITPTEAVRIVTKTAGLNDEELSRVCTMVNRKLHTLTKTSQGPGNLWRTRWNTAKPDEILGRPLNVTKSEPNTMQKESRVLEKASSTGLEKIASLVVKREEDLPEVVDPYEFPAPPPLEKVSARDVERFQATAMLEAYEHLTELGKLSKYSEARVERSLLDLMEKESELVREAEKVARASQLRAAEILDVLSAEIAGKYSNSAEVFVKTATALKVPLDYFQGSFRDEWGDLDEEKVRGWSEVLETRPEWASVMEKRSSISEFKKIQRIAEELIELDQEVLAMKDVAEQTRKDWEEAREEMLGGE